MLSCTEWHQIEGDIAIFELSHDEQRATLHFSFRAFYDMAYVAYGFGIGDKTSLYDASRSRAPQLTRINPETAWSPRRRFPRVSAKKDIALEKMSGTGSPGS